MFFNKKQGRPAAKIFMVLSLLSVLAAAWGFWYSDLWLASTQWLLVAIVLAAFGLYAKMESGK